MLNNFYQSYRKSDNIKCNSQIEQAFFSSLQTLQVLVLFFATLINLMFSKKERTIFIKFIT